MPELRLTSSAPAKGFAASTMLAAQSPRIRKFAPRRSVAPQLHVVGASRNGVEASPSRQRDDMQGLWINIAAGGVQVGRQRITTHSDALMRPDSDLVILPTCSEYKAPSSMFAGRTAIE
jgi:hypothetical protein